MTTNPYHAMIGGIFLGLAIAVLMVWVVLEIRSPHA